MFSVLYTNFGYTATRTFDNLDAALTYGKARGFEFSVWRDGELVVTWSPIGGTRRPFDPTTQAE